MRRPERLRLLILSLGMAACAGQQDAPASVLLDGLFDEWTEATTIVDDPPDAPDAAVDVLSVQALDDPAWLYFAIDVGNEVNLQALPGTLSLLLDVDASPGTGGTVAGMAGVDLMVELSDTVASLSPDRGSGFAMRAVRGDGATASLPRYALGLMAAPTWSAPRFELRLSRLGADGIPPFARRIRLKAVYAEAGGALDETAVGSYVFTATAGEAEPSRGRIPSKRDGATRVAQWNVASSRFTEEAPAFAAFLAAIEPDVVLLDELPGEVTAEALSAFFGLEPLRALGSWAFVLGESGGRQRALVAARDREALPTGWLLDVPNDERARRAFQEAHDMVSDETIRRILAADLEGGVSVAAAWIEVSGRPTLFVATDLQAGGWSGSLQDQLRTLHAATINERVRLELGGSGAPAVIGGDLNAVGSRAPLFTLIRGLDADGTDLVPADAPRVGERTYATWRNPRDRFAPGRLDFLLVPDAALTVVGAFAVAPEDLDDGLLRRYGLEPDRRLSDHVPVVADLVAATGTRGNDP